MRIELIVHNLVRENAERFESLVQNLHNARNVNTWKGGCEMEIDNESEINHIISFLKKSGFSAVNPSEKFKEAKSVCVRISGMTCRSCEIIVERKFLKIPGVKHVDVNAAKGTAKVICDETCEVNISSLQKGIEGEKYRVQGLVADFESEDEVTKNKPSLMRLIGLFALVLLIGSLFKNYLFFSSQAGVQQTVTWAAAVILGLVAGSSSCLAVSGGLLLSTAGRFRERYGSASLRERLRPVFLFVFGRILAYGFLGGLIGLLGKAFTLSSSVTGLITIAAAIFMLIMGLEMLHIAPAWLKSLMPRMPKSLAHRIVDADGSTHWAAPFFLGAATFFLPCGFTQSLQVYALTTGSFWASAMILGGFAIGTAPALLALGWASSSMKGKAGTWFFQFAGALVVVLGIWNIQNGIALTGLTLPVIASPKVDTTQQAVGGDSNVSFNGTSQVIKMALTNSSPYYSPSDTFTVKSGLPVQIQINSRGSGCRSAFLIPKLNVSQFLDQSVNIIDFTPSTPGRYTFSCGMGMYRGTLIVT